MSDSTEKQPLSRDQAIEKLSAITQEAFIAGGKDALASVLDLIKNLQTQINQTVTAIEEALADTESAEELLEEAEDDAENS